MTLAFLNIGTQEMILIVIVILLLFGGKKLPELARGLGKGIREFKDASDGIKREISDQINNFEKDLDVKVEDKSTQTPTHVAEEESTIANASEVNGEDGTVQEKKFPNFTAPENTIQHDPGAHPADENDYYKYGYNDHFASENETPKVEETAVEGERIEEKPTDTKKA